MYDLHEQDNKIRNGDPDAMTRVKKRTQQSRATGRLGGPPRSTINREQVDEEHSSVSWSVNSAEVEEVNSKFSLLIPLKVGLSNRLTF